MQACGTDSMLAGVVGGLVAYIISNGINWTLDRLGDFWADWRQGKAGPKEQPRYAKSNFGGGEDPAGGGTSIGNRRSLERWAQPCAQCACETVCCCGLAGHAWGKSSMLSSAVSLGNFTCGQGCCRRQQLDRMGHMPVHMFACSRA